MRKEYDFSGGTRGTHADAYRADSPTIILDDDLISLDPDVKAVFPDSDAVNTALRMLIKTAIEAQRVVEFSKAS